MRSVDRVRLSPDGARIAYTVVRDDQPGRPQRQLFVVTVADGRNVRLGGTEPASSPEWSPDGRLVAFKGVVGGKKGLAVSRPDGSGRRELGREVDNRQQSPAWSADGSAVFCTVQERGHVRLYRLPRAGKPQIVVGEEGRIGDYSVGGDGAIAYASTGGSDLAQLYLRPAGGAPRRLTDLNAEVLKGVEIAAVESFTFASNDFKYEVEAFLTRPIGLREGTKHPLIVMIHGGPHGQHVLQHVRADGVGDAPAPGQPHGRAVGAVGPEARGEGEDAHDADPRRERQRRPHCRVRAVLRRAAGRRRRSRDGAVSARGPRPRRAE